MTALPRRRKNEVENLILENKKWAEVVAYSVAKAWRLDAEVDGLVSASYEALVECAHRFDPSRGIPFRAYARRRVHEAACDAARQTKAWKEGQVFSGSIEAKARATAYELIKRFPELRDGRISLDTNSLRGSVRQMILGATVIYMKEMHEAEERKDFTEYGKLISAITKLDKVHQWLIWKIYWEGHSLRGLAALWNADPLTIIREHQVILGFLSSILGQGASKSTPPKVRPSLRKVIADLNLEAIPSPFEEFANSFCRENRDG